MLGGTHTSHLSTDLRGKNTWRLFVSSSVVSLELNFTKSVLGFEKCIRCEGSSWGRQQKKERKNLRKEREGKQVNFLIMLLNYVTWDTPRGETLTPTHQMRGYQLRVERTKSVSLKIPPSSPSSAFQRQHLFCICTPVSHPSWSWTFLVESPEGTFLLLAS